MKPKRKNRAYKISKWWPWISFILFGLIIVLLGTSVIKKKSPAQVLREWIATEKDSSELSTFSKNELIQIIANKDSIISSLSDKIAFLNDSGEFRRGRVNVTSDFLNMRTEPTLSAEIILRIPNSSLLVVLYFDENKYILGGIQGQWCRIRYAGQEGWVWGNYVELLDD